MFDFVTVFHNFTAYDGYLRLRRELRDTSVLPYELFPVDNRKENRGFAKGCNLGARSGENQYIGFLNPDLHIDGDLTVPVMKALKDAAITGANFNKPERTYKSWGCIHWVCGAAFFTHRSVWEIFNGFDEGFVWGLEETDFIRRVEKVGLVVNPIELPIRHEPFEDQPQDHSYKALYYEEGRKRFHRKWGGEIP